MVNGWLVGLAVGTLAALAELPNSFLKRRLNIPAGQSGPGAMRALFYFVDQVDILAGVWLAYSLVVDVTLKCVELCGAAGYSEDALLEKWARDAKILDIFEGTQQIQVLIVARRLLNKTSKELR